MGRVLCVGFDRLSLSGHLFEVFPTLLILCRSKVQPELVEGPEPRLVVRF